MNDYCQARQHSDQMVCKRCDISWDINDYNPPKCLFNAWKVPTKKKWWQFWK